jgi:hypothetical protein
MTALCQQVFGRAPARPVRRENQLVRGEKPIEIPWSLPGILSVGMGFLLIRFTRTSGSSSLPRIVVICGE